MLAKPPSYTTQYTPESKAAQPLLVQQFEKEIIYLKEKKATKKKFKTKAKWKWLHVIMNFIFLGE